MGYFWTSNDFDVQNIPMVYIMTSWYSTIFNRASMGFLRDNGKLYGVFLKPLGR
jgi:hypothetical protein